MLLGEGNMEIEIGKGDIAISTLRQGERIGVSLRRQDTAHPVGEFTGDGGQEYYPNEHPNDMVIWCESLESARILQDTVNLLVLNLQGIPRET
jgi:hypothetical protein